MADLSDLQAAQTVKIAGSPSSGIEDNYLEVNSDGSINSRILNSSGTAIDTNFGTIGANSLRTASQLGNATGAADFNYGAAGAQTLRTASQIGNATGSAAFNAGTTTAQTLRVVLPTDQSAIPVKTQDGAGNALTSTTVSTKQALDVNITNSTLSITTVTGTIDKSAFVYGVNTETPVGGVYQDTLPTLVAGTTGAVRLTTNRAFHTNLRDASGNELLGQKVMASSVPVVIASDQVVPVSFNGSDRLGTGTIIALNGTYVVNTQGMSTTMFDITGVWIGTLVIESTIDGTKWNAIEGFDDQTDSRLTTITANRIVKVICGAYQSVRLRASLFTSGVVAIASDAAVGLNEAADTDTIRNTNSALPPQAQLVGGSDGTNLIPLATDSSGRLITSAITGFGAQFSFGDITTSSIALFAVRRTAYTEQASNAQRSLVSSSANDTSAGTGARTVTITYMDSTGAGPFTEVVTLNGTTAVNTVSTTICYIEKMAVTTVGSNSSNVGTITLKAAALGLGATIGTIAAADNQTFWAHHYIPTGKTCNITGVSSGHNGTTVGSGALFILKALPIGISNPVEVQVTDFIRLYGQSSTFARSYSSPVKVIGPARLISYVTPETASSTIYRSAFDYFEP